MLTVVFVVAVFAVCCLLMFAMAVLQGFFAERRELAAERSQQQRIDSAARRGIGEAKQIRRDTVTQLFNSAVEAQMRQRIEEVAGHGDDHTNS